MLSNRQKAYLSQLARSAFNKLRADASREGRVHPAEHELAGWPLDAELWDADEFRHAQVARAVFKNGLTCCSQADYKTVEGHFLRLLGQTQRADRAVQRGAGNERRIAEHKIVTLLGAMGKQIRYAEGVCKRMSRGHDTLSTASVVMLWKVFYALNKEAGKINRRDEAQSRKAEHA